MTPPKKMHTTFHAFDRTCYFLRGFLRLAGNGVSVEGGRGEVNLPPLAQGLTRTTRSADTFPRGTPGLRFPINEGVIANVAFTENTGFPESLVLIHVSP